MSILTISNENIFSKTQGTKLDAIIEPSKGICPGLGLYQGTIVPVHVLGHTSRVRFFQKKVKKLTKRTKYIPELGTFFTYFEKGTVMRATSHA